MHDKKLTLMVAAVVMLLCAAWGSAAAFYVAVDGVDANPGTKEAPFGTLVKARDAIRALKKANRFPAGGVTIWIQEGLYRIDKTLQLGAEDSGTADGPVVYRACPGAAVIFDGSRPIDAASLQKVADPPMLARLCPKARGHVFQMTVKDAASAGALSNIGTCLSFNGRMMQLARFPNVGYCHIKKIIDKGAVYAHGRTLGPVPKYSMDAPVGGVFTIVEKPSGDWAAEYADVQKAEVVGYLSYDWYRERHKIAAIRDGAIKLLEYSRYGVLSKEKIPRRLVVRNLLCELDQPGEWYFDEKRRTLFVWPLEALDQKTRLGYWAGPAFMALSGASHVVVRDITVQCTAAGGAMISVNGGTGNRVAGCTFRNSTRTGVALSGGTRNGVVGCDLYDLGTHLILEGGDLKTLTPAGNYARNNHLTQVASRAFYGRVRIRGVGNLFQNNLLHNFVGQPIAMSGCDHRFERNEIFNIGIEEGDGGAIYSGAQMWSYGNVFRHNFLHHLMCVPQAHPRGGIYPDDLDGGDTIVENVFYKAAHRAVLLNGGAANVATHNILINGHIGIYSTEAWAEGIHKAKAKYDAGELKRGDKNDHIWRTEQVVGKEGWNRPPWSDKYPLFKKVMNQPLRRFYPIECNVSHNLFCGNAQNTAFRRTWHDKQLAPMEAVDYVEARNNRNVSMDVFRDPGCLDFRFKPGKRPDGFPEIPFERIGLQVDQYRRSMPDKAAYRRALQEKWAPRKSYDEKMKYDPGTVTDLLYFNTGRLVLEGAMVPKDLYCEYHPDPLGVDTRRPRFSWVLASPLRAQMQGAFQILVSTSEAGLRSDQGDMWDSGKVLSGRSVNNVYQGKPLAGATRYYWKIRVWPAVDGADGGVAGTPSAWSKPAAFEMGLLEPVDWRGQWIGMATGSPVAYVPGRFGQAIRLNGEAQTIRIPHYEALKPASGITICAWIKPERYDHDWREIYRKEDGKARHLVAIGQTGDIKGIWFGAGINGAYTEHGAAVPREKLLDEKWHLVAATFDGACKRIYLDGREIGQAKIDGTLDRSGSSPAYIGSSDGRGEFFQGGIDDVRVYSRALSAEEVKAMAGKLPGDEPSLAGWWPLDGSLKGKSHNGKNRGRATLASPLLRKTFDIPGKVRRARMYISALGWHELFLNGKKVGDHVLDPATTDYHKRTLYVAHDVTDYLREGTNALGVMLGNGWYCEPGRLKYGDSPRMLLQLNVVLADGSAISVVSDDTWRSSRSPILKNSIYGGETYDARLEKTGWSRSDYDDGDWGDVEIVEGPRGRLQSQLMPGIKVIQTIRPVGMTQPRPGIFVYDMGQLFGGWARLHVEGPAGAQVTIKYAARIFKDSGLVDKRRHHGDRETDYYTLKGGAEEVYEPRFTYHPVRYVQIEGYPGTPTIDSVAGRVVFSGIDMSGDFQCSEPLLNKIHQNTVWTFTNGLFGIPLDCLHREHWAWTDPATITGSLYPRKHMPLFWTKWLYDIGDAQFENGAVPDVAPNYAFTQSDPAWGGNYPLLVWYLHQYYDDKRIVEEHYTGMKRWMDYLGSISRDHIVIKGHYGDHMLPGNFPKTVRGVTSFGAADMDDDGDLDIILALDLHHDNPRGLVWMSHRQSVMDGSWAINEVSGPLPEGLGLKAVGCDRLPDIKALNADKGSLARHLGVAADMNGDGHEDVIIAARDRRLYLLLGTSAGSRLLHEIEFPHDEAFISRETPGPFVWTGYYYRGARVLSEAARLLGRMDDARHYAELSEKIKQAINDKWLDRDTNHYATGSQTADIFPLALGIVPEAHRDGVLKNVVHSVMNERGGHLRTGNTGTTCMIDALSDLGKGDALYRAVAATEYPGWGYMVKQGATTIWERWSLGQDAESMIMWATIDEFFYNDLAGIRGPEYYGPRNMAPGFRQIHIKPRVLGDLKHASASMRTVRGIIASKWRREDRSFVLTVTLPVNSQGKVSVPTLGLKAISITESGKAVWRNDAFVPGAPGITAGIREVGYMTFSVGSGTYVFRAFGK